MANYRKKPRNNLIREIRKINQAIKSKCIDCMGGGKRQDCHTAGCSLFPYRPWAKKEIKITKISDR